MALYINLFKTRCENFNRCNSNFRKMYMKERQLDPAHYVSEPSLTWESGLKITGIELESLKDQTKYEMCENEIKDVVASIMGDKYKKALIRLVILILIC